MSVNSVQALLADLKSESPEARCRAAKELLDVRGAAALIVPALLRALEDSDGSVRHAAAISLGHQHAGAEAAVGRLAEILNDPNEDQHLRSAACTALRLIGPASVPALNAALENPEEFVRKDAAHGLGILGAAALPAVPALIRALGDEDGDVRWTAAGALAAIGPGALPALEAVLREGDLRSRVYAAEAVLLREPWHGGKISREEQRAVPYRPEALDPVSTAAIWSLIEGLRHPEGRVRKATAFFLGEAVPYSRPAGPALVEALTDESWGVRDMAAGVVVHVDPNTPGLVPALAERLTDEDWPVRLSALLALGELGPKARPAIPALLGVLQADPDPALRANAADALGCIGPAAAGTLPAIREAMARNTDEQCRNTFLTAIEKLQRLRR